MIYDVVDDLSTLAVLASILLLLPFVDKNFKMGFACDALLCHDAVVQKVSDCFHGAASNFTPEDGSQNRSNYSTD